MVAMGLMLLLAATVGIAYVDLGPFNTAAAMSISLAKAGLILVFFMHLKKASPLVRLFACAGFFWLAMMLTLALGDYLTR
jgi:cytochrome c oxidase subunit 4